MSSGVRKGASGAFIGTGALLNIQTLGFKPRIVNFYNVTTLATGHWQDSMGDGALWKDVDTGSGTEDQSFVAAGGAGVTLIAGGFSIGADGNINLAGNTVHWEAQE